MALRLWQALLINWLYWTGMAMGGVVFSAILTVTGSKWGRPYKRLAELFGFFLPVSLLLFLAMYFGMDKIYPWVEHPVPGKEWWLQRNFLFGRDLLALLLLYGISFAYLFASIRPDIGGEPESGLARFIARGWRGDEAEVEIASRRGSVLAVVVIIAYGLIYSLLAYDLVMSIDATWFSTLFGAYVAGLNVYGSLALLAVTSAMLGRRLGIRDAIGEPQRHDLGKLTFGFCMLSMDFFWSQFLVIWYGNLPEESGFIVTRAFDPMWKPFAWTVAIGLLVAPFVLLLRRRMKTQPGRLAAIGALVCVVLWLERFMLVAPSAWPGDTLPLGAIEAVVTILAGGLFFGALFFAAGRLPTLPVSDPLLDQSGLHHHVIGEPDYMPGDQRPA